MIYGRVIQKLQYKLDKGNSLWERGIVLSFDLDTIKLKIYYSKTSPQGAYDVVKRFLKKNGFEHKKDSDYVNINIDKVTAAELMYFFAKENKWFPLCINKMNISPNVETLDISAQLKLLVDEKWKQQKDLL